MNCLQHCLNHPLFFLSKYSIIFIKQLYLGGEKYCILLLSVEREKSVKTRSVSDPRGSNIVINIGWLLCVFTMHAQCWSGSIYPFNFSANRAGETICIKCCQLKALASLIGLKCNFTMIFLKTVPNLNFYRRRCWPY